MLTRRALTTAAAGFAVLARARLAQAEPQPASPGAVQAQGAAHPNGPASQLPATPLDVLFTKFANEMLIQAPERATSLGLDVGERAPLRGQLHDFSLDGIAQNKADTARRLSELRAIDRSALTGLDAANYDTVLFSLATEVEANQLFNYGTGGARSPYVLSQLTGAYQAVPDFLDTQHPLKTIFDGEDYLARMQAFADGMDQEIDVFTHDLEHGVIPPDFIIDKALEQMQAFADTPAEKATLVTSLSRRTLEANIPGRWHLRVVSGYTYGVLPALRRQIDTLKAARNRAVHTAGVGHLPHGADFYRLGLKSYTTSSMQPDEIHKTGQELVASLSADIDTALRKQGLTDGSVGQRLAALAADKKYLYDNTDAGKDQLLADLNKLVAGMQARLPERFDHLPKSTVEIRRVPKTIEAGAPGGYYQRGSLDGTRPGAYYINLHDTGEWPRWGLPTLTYHEAIPGHHLQISLAQETAKLPLIRKMLGNSGYSEGWALYAEQLAVEMGMYDGDPLGHIGQLQAALFRAVRLVVDSGIHAQNWSREQAVDYYVDKLGEKRGAAIREVERYCVWPGQACSYMIGKITWLRARAHAQKALGAKFDIKTFHDVGLLSGALPLDVLERVVADYAKV